MRLTAKLSDAQTQQWLQLFARQSTPRQFVESAAQRVEIGRVDGKAGRHRVAAVAYQQVVAFPQRRREVETFNAAPRTAPFVSFAAQDDRGPVKLAQHARSNNADDADVPKQLAFDNDVIRFRVESRAHGADDFLRDAAFDLLALAVPRVQIAGQGFGFRAVPREQQMQRFRGGFQSSRRIEPWPQLKADFINADHSPDVSHCL